MLRSPQPDDATAPATAAVAVAGAETATLTTDVMRRCRKVTLTVKRTKLEAGWELERKADGAVVSLEHHSVTAAAGVEPVSAPTIQLRVNNRPIRLRLMQAAAATKPPLVAVSSGGAQPTNRIGASAKKKEGADSFPRVALMRRESSVKRVTPGPVLSEDARLRRNERAISIRHQLRCSNVWRVRGGGVYIDAEIVGDEPPEGEGATKPAEGDVGGKRRREFVFDVYREVSSDDEDTRDAAAASAAVQRSGGILKDFSDDDESECWWREHGSNVDARSAHRKAADTLRRVPEGEAWELLDITPEEEGWIFDEADDDDNADELDYAHDHRFDDEYDSNAEKNAIGDYPDEDDAGDGDVDGRRFGAVVAGHSAAFARAANPFLQYGDDHAAEDFLADSDVNQFRRVLRAVTGGRPQCIEGLTKRASYDDDGADEFESDEEHADLVDSEDERNAVRHRASWFPGEKEAAGSVRFGDSDDDAIDACWERRVRRNEREWARFEREAFGVEDDDHEWRRKFEGIVIGDPLPHRTGMEGWGYEDVDDDDEFGGADVYQAMARHEPAYDDDELGSCAPDDVEDWGYGECVRRDDGEPSIVYASSN